MHEVKINHCTLLGYGLSIDINFFNICLQPFTSDFIENYNEPEGGLPIEVQ